MINYANKSTLGKSMGKIIIIMRSLLWTRFRIFTSNLYQLKNSGSTLFHPQYLYTCIAYVLTIKISVHRLHPVIHIFSRVTAFTKYENTRRPTPLCVNLMTPLLTNHKQVLLLFLFFQLLMKFWSYSPPFLDPVHILFI